MASIKAVSVPGFEDDISAMIADGKTTGPEAAVQIIAKQKAQMGDQREGIKKDGAAVNAPEAPTEAQGAGTEDPLASLEGEELFKAEFQSRKDIKAEYVTEGSYVAMRKRGEPCPAKKEV